jgi:L-fucose mutarotase/ribose pyranase (RbsD/FucU family)
MKIGTAAKASTRSCTEWHQILRERLPLYGHRNWIVIADSAYPAQSRDGIETIVADADQLEVVQTVLAELAGSRHVKAIVYTDAELPFVDNIDAPGIDTYRQRLNTLLAGAETKGLPHEEIIARLDHAGEAFRVLIIKTNLTLPYTSVFLQLDCAYWNADAEARLRTHVPQKVF